MRRTEKLYHQDAYLREATARVLAVAGDEVVTDRTLFYPEGGGQVGDRGTLAGCRVRDTQQRGGRRVVAPGLPDVHVETEVVHLLEPGAAMPPAPGDEVRLVVDAAHRSRCMRLHGATHLVMGRLAERFGAESFATEGCHIDATRARLDLRTEERYGGEILAELEAGVNEWIASDAAVEMAPIPGVPEMFLWRCALSPQLTMPCGGTHVARLGEIEPVRLQRKREGKGLERVYVRLAGDGA
jgi:alanyl-tRNA synthetase